jgi:hypothetical protein
MREEETSGVMEVGKGTYGAFSSLGSAFVMQ